MLVKKQRYKKPYGNCECCKKKFALSFAEELIVKRECEIKRDYGRNKPAERVDMLCVESNTRNIFQKFYDGPVFYGPAYKGSNKIRDEYPPNPPVVEPC